MRIIVDISNFQGVPDFNHLKSLGVQGVIIKATEGHWVWTNPYFDAQVNGAKAAGLAIGFYTFVHPGDVGTGDADLFLQKIAGHNPQLGVWLDCEVSDGVDPATALQRILADAKVLAAKYPFRTGIYTAEWWWGPNTVGSANAHIDQLCALWVAGYTAQLPQLPAPWRAALMWQFTDHFAGMNMDASYFLGTDAQWDFLTKGITPPVKPLQVSFAEKTKGVQAAVHVTQDGVFGPETDKRCMVIREMRSPAATANKDRVKFAQQVMAFPGASANGIWDQNTHNHWTSTVKAIQTALGCPVTGLWDVPTDYSFMVLNPIR